MEEGRPGKKFWEIMLFYTVFILFAKFIFQLDIWLTDPTLVQNYKDVNVI